MAYRSILYDRSRSEPERNETDTAGFIRDLHIDRIVGELLAGKEEYGLEPLFYDKLPDAAAIRYRTDVFRDIEGGGLLEPFLEFSRKLRKVREFSGYAETHHDREQREKWLLDAAYEYCSAILAMRDALQAAKLRSEALLGVRKWLDALIQSNEFAALSRDTFELREVFDSARYNLLVRDRNIIVYPEDNENVYCRSLNEVLGRGKWQEEDYTLPLFGGVELSSLENDLLEILQKHYAPLFKQLKAYAFRHARFVDPDVMEFGRELQFYIACLQTGQFLRRKGLSFSIPTITERKEVRVKAGYDLSLAMSKQHAGLPVVPNDFDMESGERLFVITGPNQGGKTTFLRAVGQILHLASIGCPVPCESAELYVFDRLFTHFPAEEQSGMDTGRLKEELIRLKDILDQATKDSVVLFNELFSTTATHDALAMGSETMRMLDRRGTACLYVTHLVELASATAETVSLVAGVDPENPSVRTYRIQRREADGQAYASSIVDKYGLTLAGIREKMGR